MDRIIHILLAFTLNEAYYFLLSLLNAIHFINALNGPIVANDFRSMCTGFACESCEPITRRRGAMCAQRCVHSQPVAYLLSTSTNLCKSSSTNQMESDGMLTN